MPNVFKYNTSSTEIQSLRRGNFYIGIGDVAKGPTPDTGFWNGVIVGTFSYVIVLHSGENVPTFYQIQNDAELILRTNQIDKSVVRTTKEECFSYFSGQSDKMIVNRDYESVVTDGLVLNLDAGFLPSYPGTGSSWYDLGSGQSNGTLQNGPIFNSGGWINFDGSNDRCSIPNQTFNSTSNSSFTIEIIFKRNSSTPSSFKSLYGIGNGSSSTNARINFFFDNNNNGSMAINYYVSGGLDRYITLNSQLLDTNFHHSVQVIDKVNLQMIGYFDGINKGNGTITNSSTSDTIFSIGHGSSVNASVALLKIYNRVLSQSEILQNYYQGPIVTDGLVFFMDPANLVSYTNTSNIAYSLIGGYTASLENGTTFSTANSGVFDLDGSNDYIQMPHNNYWNSNVFGTATNFTIECWYKPDLFMNWDTMIWKQNPNVGGWYSSPEGAAIWSDQNGFVAVFSSGTASNPGGSLVQIFYATTTLKWYHLCFTGDGATLRFYVDGVQRGTALVASRTVAVTTSSNGPSFGRRDFMNGQLGNVKFYTRHLSASEVVQNFNAHRSRYAI